MIVLKIMLCLVLFLALDNFPGSQSLFLSGHAYAQPPCCPCGGPCPMWNARGTQTCQWCICGSMARMTAYNSKTGTGTLQVRNLHDQLETLLFHVPKDAPGSVREKLGTLKKGEEHQFSLQFKAGKGLTVQCYGVDENLPDHSPKTAVALALREALSGLHHPAEHPVDKQRMEEQGKNAPK